MKWKIIDLYSWNLSNYFYKKIALLCTTKPLTFQSHSNMMCHLPWNLERHLRHTTKHSIFVPGRLPDHLSYSIFFNGIDIGLGSFKHRNQFGTGRFGMTFDQTWTDRNPAIVVFRKRLLRSAIHVKNDTMKVANGNCSLIFIKPTFHRFNLSRFFRIGANPINFETVRKQVLIDFTMKRCEHMDKHRFLQWNGITVNLWSVYFPNQLIAEHL